MKFTDLLLWLLTVSNVILFVLDLKTFYSKVKDFADNVDIGDQERDKKISNRLLKLQFFTLIKVLAFFALSLLCFLFGSTPRNIETLPGLCVLPFLLLFILIPTLCILLYKYYTKIAITYNVISKPHRRQRVRRLNDYFTSQKPKIGDILLPLMMVFISFYLALPIFFATFNIACIICL